MANIQENSISSTAKGEVVLAACLAVLAVLSVALPVVNVKVMGFGSGIALTSPLLLGSIAFLLPLIFLVALGAKFVPQAMPYARPLQIAGLVVAAGVALHTVVTLLNEMRGMSDMNRQMTQMLGSAGSAQFGSVGELSMASAGFALALLVLGSAWTVWSGRRR